jgi:DNA processing protein
MRSSRDVDDVRALLAAREIPGLGDVKLARRLADLGSARAVLDHQGADVRDAAYRAADASLAAAAQYGCVALACSDERYPARLRELDDAPVVVFAKGTLAAAEPPAVAIVGTRGASSYGLRMARAIATTCARAGATVVSGLAQGIDGAAHEAALAVGGRTVAVLGTGIGVSFPRRHHTLQTRIGVEGLLLSELATQQSGHGGTFPRRNRLIAALADVTVVVEAGVESGALITAQCALALSRPVLCVPNAIDVPSSLGSNALLKAHAEPLLCPDDVLETLSLRAQPTPAPILDAEAASCWDAIVHGAADIRAVAQAARLSIRQAASALTALEVEGLVVVEPTGRIRTTVGPPTRVPVRTETAGLF